MPATYTDNGNTPNGSQLVFTYTFPALQTEDVRVAIDGKTQITTKYTVDNTSNPTKITFNNTDIDTTVQESTGAPKTGVTVRVYRQTIVGKDTGDEDPKAVYSAGSSVRAIDLNDNQRQDLYGIHEIQEQPLRYFQVPFGLIDSDHIKDGSIIDADISPTAEIQVSKLKNGTARQVLQTATNGTDVEWTSNVALPGTLGVTGESTLASATVSDLTSGRIVFTSTGGALVDSANLTFDTTGNGHLKVGVEGAYGTITCGTINATYWNGDDNDKFWRTNKNSIDHYGKDTGYDHDGSYVPAIQIRKDSGNLSSGHKFAIAKDYTFEIGRYVNEGAALGVWNTLHYAPVFRAKQAIEQDRITNTSSNNPGQSSSDYSVFTGSQGCEDEHGEIWIGDGSEGYGYNLTGTTLKLGGFTSFDARRNGIWNQNNNPSDPDGYQPVLMLSGQKGAMFVHPDNTSHISSGSNPRSGLPYLAYGAGGHGVRALGDSYNYGGDGYRDPDECIDLLEAAADLQIIVGGARVKNKFEIGSSTVTGTLALSGTNVTSTATELNVLDGIPATLTSGELGYVDGVTSNIQTQIDGKQPADDELTELATMGATTASALADLTQAEVQIIDGKTFRASGDGTLSTTLDTEIPSSKVVADHVTAAIAPLGGFEAIADEDSFPAIPAAGIIISIADASGITVNSSGVSTTARTAGNGSDNVTINNFPTTLRGGNGDNADPFPLPNNTGLLVVSTGSSNTYDFHRLLPTSSDVKQLSDDVNDFFARYRIESSAPPSNNDAGDLYYDTTEKKMKVYNAVDNQWDDVAQSSSSYIVTLSEAFDDNRTDFTMSTAATDAQSTLVSINGVLQKPNAGTSTPSEGFAISGSTLKLAAAPPTGSDYFVVVLGDTVSIGTPSDNTVTSAKIVNGSIIDEDINTSAAIARTKLANVDLVDDVSPQLGGDLDTNSFEILLDDDHKIKFGASSTMNIRHTGSYGILENATGGLYLRSSSFIELRGNNNETFIKATEDGSVELYHGIDGSTAAEKKLETTSTGVSVTGDVTASGKINIGSSTHTTRKLAIHDTTNTAIVIEGASNGSSSVLFADENDEDVGFISYNHNTDDLLLTAEDNIILTSGAGAKLQIRDGNTTGNIKFNAVNSAENANVNLEIAATDTLFFNGGTEKFRIDSDGKFISNSSSSGDYIRLYASSGTGKWDIYGNGANLRISDNDSAGKVQIDSNLYLPDGCILEFGDTTTPDLEISHTSNANYIKTTTSNLYIDTQLNSGEIRFTSNNVNENMIRAKRDAEVELYYNGEGRVLTQADGVKIGPNTGSDTWLRVTRDTWAQQCGLIVNDASGNTDSRDWYIYQSPSSNALQFYTSGANKRRVSLTSLGYLKAGNTVAWTDTTTCHEFSQSAANWTFQSLNGHSTAPYGIQIYFPGRNTGSDDDNNHFINCHDSTAARFRVFGSGDAENQNNSWEGVSDIKLKENIVDASSQWDDIKNIKVRNFNFKTNPSRKLLGVVAQEIETISPGLVKETVDRDADNKDLGTTTKSVRYSILYMKAIKALQEAMAKIETLETKVAALEAK